MANSENDSSKNNTPNDLSPTPHKKPFNFYLSRILEIHKTSFSKRADTPNTPETNIKPKKNKL